MNPRQFIGRAPEQVDDFLADIIDPIRARYAASETLAAEVKV
jgi:adenylosuccinate lyase